MCTGISYITHPQAIPITVTEFKNIEKITTSLLQNTTVDPIHRDNTALVGSSLNQISDESTISSTFNEITTLLKIKVAGNMDDLTITCNGVNTADNIADLVDGYCFQAKFFHMFFIFFSFISFDECPKSFAIVFINSSNMRAIFFQEGCLNLHLSCY